MSISWTYRSDATSMQHDDTICTIYSARVPRNHHRHHLPTSDITRSSQDQIKLGINNTVVIIKWPQGAWSLPMILAQHHEYPTTLYPRYHGDQSRITNETTLGSTSYLITKRWSFTDHKRNHSWLNGLPCNQTVIIHGSHNQLISSSNRSCH